MQRNRVGSSLPKVRILDGHQFVRVSATWRCSGPRDSKITFAICRTMRLAAVRSDGPPNTLLGHTK